MAELAIVAVAFFVVGVPVVAVVALRAYWMWLQDQQVRGLLEERKLLIEKGATDLPPFEPLHSAWEARPDDPSQQPAPAMPPPLITHSRARLAAFWAGGIMLVVSLFVLILAASQQPHRGADELLAVALILLAIGVVLLLTGALLRPLARRPITIGAYEGNEAGGPPAAVLQPVPAANTAVRSVAAWIGIILLVLGACLVLWYTADPRGTPDAAVIVGLILAAIGLVLLLATGLARAFAPPVYAVAAAHEGAGAQPPQLLEFAGPRDPLRNLKAGVTLLLLAAAFVGWEYLTPTLVSGFRPQLMAALGLGAIGVALLVVHFTESYYARAEGRSQPDERDPDPSV